MSDFNQRKAEWDALISKARDTIQTRISATRDRVSVLDYGTPEHDKESRKYSKFYATRDVLSCIYSLTAIDEDGDSADDPFWSTVAIATGEHGRAGKLSYAKPDAVGDDRFQPGHRLMEKFHKFFSVIVPRRQFGLDPETDMESHTKRVISQERTGNITWEEVAGLLAEVFGELNTQRDDYEISLVDVGKIAALYSEEYFGSCMHNDSHLVSFYDNNPDAVRGVQVRRQGRLIARALLWLQVERSLDPDGQKVEVLDRIYPSNDSADYTRALQAWAADRGVYTWRQQNSLGGRFLKNEVYTVQVKASSDDQYPYIDSFQSTNDDPSDSGILTLTTDDGDYVFNSTGGGYEGQGDDDDRPWCNSCEEHVDDTYEVYNDLSRNSRADVCDYCRDDHYSYIDEAHGEYSFLEGEYISNDEATYAEGSGITVLNCQAVNVIGDDDDEYYDADDDIVQLSDGRYALKSETHTCPIDGVLYHEDDMQLLEDGRLVYEDNAEEGEDDLWYEVGKVPVFDEDGEIVLSAEIIAGLNVTDVSVSL